MYNKDMKSNTGALELKDSAGKYHAEPAESMVRTQVYLTRAEHDFVQREAARLSKPMAAVLRGFIDEKMEVPDEAWANSPLLQPPADHFDAPEDAAINHDHYIYGGPKKYGKRKGKWVLLPPLK